MKKLEKKQIPAVIALGVITAGGLGYSALQVWKGMNPPREAPASVDSGTVASMPYGPGAAPQPAGALGITNPKVKGMAQLQAVPPSFAADPFRPAFAEERATSQGNARIARDLGSAFASLSSKFPFKPEPVSVNAPSLPPSGEWTPAALQGEAPAAPGSENGAGAPAPGRGGPGETAPAAVMPVQRPSLLLTGVIEGDPSVAILRGDQEERHFVRVNDRVAGRYVVKAINADGILLTASSGSRPDRWFLPLGGEKN
jgi:hypothetical protein